MQITKIYDSQIEKNNKPLFPTSDVMYFPTFVSEGSNVLCFEGQGKKGLL